MTIKYRSENIDGNDLDFRIYGPDTADGTVREAIVKTTISEWGTPQNWIDNNQAEAQALIDAGTGKTAFTTLQESKNFLEDNPGAINIFELGPNPLHVAIADRTPEEENLLLETLLHLGRVLYAERQGE